MQVLCSAYCEILSFFLVFIPSAYISNLSSFGQVLVLLASAFLQTLSPTACVLLLLAFAYLQSLWSTACVLVLASSPHLQIVIFTAHVLAFHVWISAALPPTLVIHFSISLSTFLTQVWCKPARLTTLVARSKTVVIWICYMLIFRKSAETTLLSEYLKEEKSGFNFTKTCFDWERLDFAKYRIFSLWDPNFEVSLWRPTNSVILHIYYRAEFWKTY